MANSDAVHVALTPSPEASEGLTLLQRAQSLIIKTKADHEACRAFITGAKQLRRKVEDHYAAIKKPLNAARATVLEMEKQHLGPIDSAIATAERQDTAYVREQQRIEAERLAELRRQAEAVERERRAKEAADAEAEALRLEAAAEGLSAREQRFVDLVSVGTEQVKAASIAGYKDAAKQAARLIDSVKITRAIEDAIKARRIREAAAAAAAQPILVDVAPVQSEAVDGGMRTYYSCGSVDLSALIGAILGGSVPMEAIQPNTVFLNAQARSLKELFPKVYRGCELVKRDGVVG